MCGICGVISLDSEGVDREIIHKMCNAMVHRGPDDEGIYLSDRYTSSTNIRVGLGHRRLSIIDLNTGHQPIHNEDRTVWVIANGEIYNFPRLRRRLIESGHNFYTNTDIEVIVHAYEDYGETFVKYINGMFALGLWDERQKKLLLARDRIGKKPLLYAQCRDKFIFASEFKAILEYPLLKPEVNPEAIHFYLRYFYVPAPMSAFKGIHKLLPGHILVFQDGKMRIQRYWSLDFSDSIDIAEEEAIERIYEYLSEAVKSRLISDVPLGAFLSGGIDSSTVVALMCRLSRKKVKTFSIGFSEQAYNELDYAREVAEYYNTEHREFIVNPNALEILPDLVETYGEPFADSSAVPTYYVSKATSQFVKVALSGDGGDENFAGYERLLANRWATRFQLLPPFIRSALKNVSNLSAGRYSDTKDTFGRIQRFIKACGLSCPERYEYWLSSLDKQLQHSLYSDEFFQKIIDVNTTELMARVFGDSKTEDIVNSSLFAEIQLTLPNDYLVKVDIASMMNSLEVRCPFLDYRLMEFTASLPSYLKLRFINFKYILKKMILKYNLLPARLLNRKKMGFAIPVSDWIRNELADLVNDILLSPLSLKRGYFNPQMLKHIVRQHMSGRQNYGPQIWTLIILELWHRSFIDKK